VPSFTKIPPLSVEVSRHRK